MIEKSIARLQFLCDTIPPLLSAIDESTFSVKPQPEKWSKKEILGHLIDSATNNHQRFIRGQFEETPKIKYDQNKWNECNAYQNINSKQLISFWVIYNLHLLGVIKHIPSEKLGNKINTGGENDLTLGFLINDYVEHLEYHLHQLVVY